MSGTRNTSVAIPHRDAQIIARCGFGLERQTDVAKDMGLSKTTVHKVMRSENARAMLMNALEQEGLTIEKIAKKHVELLDCDKEMNVDGTLQTVSDNVTQVAVLKEINAIYGNYAPKEFDIRGSVAQAPLDELASQIEDSIEQLELDGPAGEPDSLAGDDGEG